MEPKTRKTIYECPTVATNLNNSTAKSIDYEIVRTALKCTLTLLQKENQVKVIYAFKTINLPYPQETRLSKHHSQHSSNLSLKDYLNDIPYPLKERL
jgi:hypothetical protein